MNTPVEILALAKAKLMHNISISAEFLALAEFWADHYETEQAMSDDLRRHIEAAARDTPQQRAAIRPVKAEDTAAGNTYLLVLRGVQTTYALHHGQLKRTPKKCEIYVIKS